MGGSLTSSMLIMFPQRSKSSGIFSNPRSVSAGILKVSLRICRAMRKVGDAGRFSREVHLFKQVAVALVAAQAIHMRIDLQAAQTGVTLFVGTVQPLKGLIG